MSNKVSYIIQLKDKFGRVAEKFQRQFVQIEQAAKSANARLLAFQKTAGRMGRKMAGTGAVMTAAVTAPFVVAANRLTTMAADAEEGQAKFNAVFDSISDKANQAASAYASSFGVAQSTARDMLSGTGDLLSGFGFDDQAALDISTRVAELGADLAAFQNLEGGAADASDRITKALLGETESAKALGIVIRQNTAEFRAQVKAAARANGISEQQAKSLVILAEVERQSANAIGATSREWLGYTSVSKRANQRTKEAAESFGRVLIPVMQKLREAQERVADWLFKLSPATKKWVVGLAALAAILGPLLVIVGGIAIAFSLVTLPILLISAAITGVIALVGLLVVKWDSFVNGIKSAATSVRDFFGVLGGDDNSDKFDRRGRRRSAPTAPVSGGGSLAGEIVVSATGGATVESTSLSTQGAGLDIGMNMGGRGTRRGRR